MVGKFFQELFMFLINGMRGCRLELFMRGCFEGTVLHRTVPREHVTRVTLSTSTLIDHIATNNNSNISRSGVLKTTFSDHYMVFCVRKFRGAFKKRA